LEHDQRRVVGAVVADYHDLADQGRGGADGAFDVGRRHVLAGDVDDQLFLPVDDRHVAVGVDGGDVAGVQPVVLINGLGGAGGVAAVAAHDRGTAGKQFAIVVEFELHAGNRHADGADPDGVGRVDRGTARQFRHAPQL